MSVLTPTIEAGSTPVTTGGAALTRTVVLPSGTQVGDEIRLFCISPSNITTFSCPNFTINANYTPANSGSVGVLKKVYTGTEGWTPGVTTLTVTVNSSHPFIVWPIVTNNSTEDPAVGAQTTNTGGSQTLTTTGVTNTKPNDLLIWVGEEHFASGATVTAGITIPAGFTSLGAEILTSGVSMTNCGVKLAYMVAGAAGPTGNQNGTIGAGTNGSIGLLVSLRATVVNLDLVVDGAADPSTSANVALTGNHVLTTASNAIADTSANVALGGTSALVVANDSVATTVQALTLTVPAAGWTSSAEGGTSGTTVTPANSGTSGEPFDVVTIGAGSTLTYDNAHAAHGTKSYKFVSTGSNALLEWNTQLGTVTELWWRTYLYMTANPVAGQRIFAANNGSTRYAMVYINSAGLVQANDTITMQAESVGAIPLNQWCRIEGRVVGNATTGFIEVKIFATADSSTPSETISASGLDTGGAMDAVWWGCSTIASATFWLDDMGMSTVGYMGPSVSVINTSLVIAAVADSTTAGALTLAQQHSLAVASSSDATVAGNAVLVQVHVLLVGVATDSTTSTAIVLTGTHSLAVAGAADALTAAALVLTGTHSLTVAAAGDSLTSTVPALTGIHSLAVAAASDALTSTVPALTGTQILVIAAAVDALTSTVPALTQIHKLTVAGAGDSLTASSLAVTISTALVIAAAADALGCDIPNLTGTQLLALAAAAMATTAGGAVLTQVHHATIAGASVPLVAGVPVLTGVQSLSLAAVSVALVAGVPALGQVHQLQAAAALLATRADACDVNAAVSLFLASGSIPVTSAALLLGQLHLLAVNSVAEPTSAANVLLGVISYLALGDAALGTSSGSLALTGIGILVVISGSVALIGQALVLGQLHRLATIDATEAITVATPILSQDHRLVIAPARDSLTASSGTLAVTSYLDAEDCSVTAAAASVTLGVVYSVAAAPAELALGVQSTLLAQEHHLTTAGSSLTTAATAPDLVQTCFLSVNGAQIAVGEPTLVVFQKAGAPYIFVNGTWATKPVRVYRSNGDWQGVPMKRWDGASWELV